MKILRQIKLILKHLQGISYNFTKLFSYFPLDNSGDTVYIAQK